MHSGQDGKDNSSFLPLELAEAGVAISFPLPLEENVTQEASNDFVGQSIPRYFVRTPLGVSADLPLTHQTAEVLAYVLLYNIALAWHLKGMDTCDGKQKHHALGRAREFYAFSKSIASGGRVVINDTLYMALVNNSGHVHFELGETEEANQCFQALLEAIMLMVERSERQEQDLDGFISNIVPIVLRQEESAPGA
jgi:hypothetical protein